VSNKLVADVVFLPISKQVSAELTKIFDQMTDVDM